MDRTTAVEYFEGNVKKGQIIRTEGHLVVRGDVQHGGVVQASGNIFIMGAVYGVAWAGAAGDKTADIIALRFYPAQVRIAESTKNFQKDEKKFRYNVSRAYLINNSIFIEQYL